MSILNTQLLFRAKDMFSGQPVTSSAGQQQVFIHIKHQDTHYVLLHDNNSGALYIERIKSPLRVDIYTSDNFEKIEDDNEWKAIYNVLDEIDVIHGKHE